MIRALAAMAVVLLSSSRPYAQAEAERPGAAPAPPSFDLSAYTLERGPIALSVPDNCSGLAFCPLSRTIFVAVNKPPLLLEIGLDGKTRRKIELAGFDDTEDVAWVKGNTLAVIEERRRNLCRFDLGGGARAVAYAKAEKWLVDPVDADNVGLEGLAWDPADGCFFVVKEKTPRAIYRVSVPGAKTREAEIATPWDIEQRSLSCDDLSGVCYHPATGHLLILSDESKCVVEATVDGREIGRLSLRSGSAGLPADIRQPEGITVDDRGKLYICSEPNQLYVFARGK